MPSVRSRCARWPRQLYGRRLGPRAAVQSVVKKEPVKKKILVCYEIIENGTPQKTEFWCATSSPYLRQVSKHQNSPAGPGNFFLDTPSGTVCPRIGRGIQ